MLVRPIRAFLKFVSVDLGGGGGGGHLKHY